MMKKNRKRNKLRSCAGDTLVEILVSVLIVTLTLSFLGLSVNSAGAITGKVRDTDVSFQTGDSFAAASGEQNVETADVYVVVTRTPDSTEPYESVMDGRAAVRVYTVYHDDDNSETGFRDFYRYYERR